jgi:hypothetical protein
MGFLHAGILARRKPEKKQAKSPAESGAFC